MVSRDGFEPSLDGSSDHRFPELSYLDVEPSAGFAPATYCLQDSGSAWLSYDGMMVERMGLEPNHQKVMSLPCYPLHYLSMVLRAGFEPAKALSQLVLSQSS